MKSWSGQDSAKWNDFNHDMGNPSSLKPVKPKSYFRPKSIPMQQNPILSKRVGLALLFTIIAGLVTAQICIPPLISTQPTGVSVCAGGTTSLAVIAVGLNLRYQWQVDSGSGYTNCSNGVTYTGALTSTLKVTAAAGLNGYKYRCVISNACGSITTNSCLLTIPNLSGVATPSVICAGASATLSVKDGVNFVWNTGATSSAITVSPATTTTYSVTGTTLAGCTSTLYITVTVNPSPNVTISASPSAEICAGASTTLTASGASTYRWNTGATSASITVSPESTTTYTVTGTNSIGCSKTASITVTVDPLPNVTADASPAAICTGATSTLTASGASTYQWNTGETSASITVSPGETTTYTVTGTNSSGCSQTTSVTVSVNPSPTSVTAYASPETLCAGASSTLTASGADAYYWSTGETGASIVVNPIEQTTYAVSGFNGSGCSAIATVTVYVNPSPVVTVSALPSSICPGSSSTLTADGADAYFWSTGESGPSIVVTPTEPTTYTVSGFNGIGCSSFAGITVEVDSGNCTTMSSAQARAKTAGDFEQQNSNEDTGTITLYPNPSKGISFVKNAPADAVLEVYNEFGERVGNGIMEGGSAEVNLSQQGKGVYLVRISRSGSVVYQGRVVRE